VKSGDWKSVKRKPALRLGTKLINDFGGLHRPMTRDQHRHSVSLYWIYQLFGGGLEHWGEYWAPFSIPITWGDG